jgi:hypothetical protein
MEENQTKPKRKDKHLTKVEVTITLEIDKKKLQLAIGKLSRLHKSLPEYANTIPLKLIIDPTSILPPTIVVEPPPTSTPNEPGRITITAGGGRITETDS